MSAYGYCRCSTNERKQDIDGQKRMILKYGVPEENIFWEYGSGTKREREKLNLLLNTVKQYDSIYTTEVSRLSRSTEHLCEIIDIVYKKKIKLVIGSFVVDCTAERPDPMTEGMLKMWGVFAEMEKNMICARIKYGIDNARAKGKTLGRPKTTEQNIPNVFYRYLQKYQKKEISISEFARLCDCSRTTIYKYLNITENSSYGSFLYSTIGGSFFLLSVFTGAVHKGSCFILLDIKFLPFFHVNDIPSRYKSGLPISSYVRFVPLYEVSLSFQFVSSYVYVFSDFSDSGDQLIVESPYSFTLVMLLFHLYHWL